MLDSTGHQHGYARSAAGRGCRLGRRLPLGDHVAAIDPDLDADAAVGGVGVNLAVADVGAQRVERDAAFLVPLAAGHLRAAEATRHLDADALGAGLHGALDGLLDRLAEGDAAGQLLGDVARDEHGVELGLADLLDLQLDLARGHPADLLAQRLDVRAALADDDARLGGVNGDRHVVDAALDVDQADARVGQPLGDQLADGDVFLEQRRCRTCRRTTWRSTSGRCPRRKPYG